MNSCPSFQEFDYVIVGAGAAGALLAMRLGERGNGTVCVLEAGPADRSPYLHIPAGFIKVLFDERYTWQFQTEPSDETHGRRIALPQGRTLGGSTSINGMVYNRGQREDYDNWAALGNPGWSFDDVLPYFKRTESFAGPDPDGLRGRDGPLKVSLNDWIHPVCEAFVRGAQEMQIPKNDDYNGASQGGVGYYQRTIHRGRRVSAARAFVEPARRLKNVEFCTNVQATCVVFEGTRAVGVEFTQAGALGARRIVRARKEVIVCAGAINTPKLLQLSGVGPGALLHELGIPVISALDGVGQHLQDHFAVRLVAKAKGAVTINELARMPRLMGQVVRWLTGQPSVLAICPSVVQFHWHSSGKAQRPDIQGVFSPASYKAGRVGVLDDYPGMSCGFWQHRPESMGSVTIRSADAADPPIIVTGYLTHERDRQVMIDGFRLCRELLKSAALSQYFDGEMMPGRDVLSDEQILTYIGMAGASSYHLNGTARMGRNDDAGAVVDASLRVYGTSNLRVVDASVMPSIPSANICAATMMIAEKAADLIGQT